MINCSKSTQKLLRPKLNDPQRTPETDSGASPHRRRTEYSEIVTPSFYGALRNCDTVMSA